MADRDLTVEAAELLFVEDLRHEPEVAQRRETPVLGDRDAGRLLAAVLQREQAEVREPCDIAIRCMDPEDAAHQATTPIWTKPRFPSRFTLLGLHPRIAAPRCGL